MKYILILWICGGSSGFSNLCGLPHFGKIEMKMQFANQVDCEEFRREYIDKHGIGGVGPCFPKQGK